MDGFGYLFFWDFVLGVTKGLGEIENPVEPMRDARVQMVGRWVFSLDITMVWRWGFH